MSEQDVRGGAPDVERNGGFTTRLAAFSELDKATFTYDIFAISIGSVILGYVYGKDIDTNNFQILSTNQDFGIKVATPVGTFVGQLLFDGIELLIIVVSTFAQALAGHGPSISIITVLIVWRFLMGIGIGGDYPVSAVISSEFASPSTRGRMIVGTFSAQGWGTFTAGLVGLIITAAYKDSILNPATFESAVDSQWRILIGLGCVPGVIALYCRLTIPETPRWTLDVERNVQEASNDINLTELRVGTPNGDNYYIVDRDAGVHRARRRRASLADFRAYFGRWKNLKVLIGTCWSWFALDIAFYGVGLNSSVILPAFHFGPSPNGAGNQRIYANLLNICIGNLVLSAGGLIPGYYLTFFLVDKWGRKPIQLLGFTVLSGLYLAMGFAYDKLVTNPEQAFGTFTTPSAQARTGLIILYCFANFFQNFGPNSTTFTIPGEVFPTRYRSTGHGISAASGKLGAIVAEVLFSRIACSTSSCSHIKLGTLYVSERLSGTDSS
ncbi:hypothetical protein H0H92_003703 [Tricholoma furcatifolium]|nr:hypothetical protein H0H92_003703 [Tricholoma furcatifolium]